MKSIPNVGLNDVTAVSRLVPLFVGISAFAPASGVCSC